MLIRISCALGLLLALAVPADARCNEICQQKCRANPGPQSVENCIKLWSCINANYKNTASFENARPPAKCRHLFKPKS
jgi:hypothetical protein